MIFFRNIVHSQHRFSCNKIGLLQHLLFHHFLLSCVSSIVICLLSLLFYSLCPCFQDFCCLLSIADTIFFSAIYFHPFYSEFQFFYLGSAGDWMFCRFIRSVHSKAGNISLYVFKYPRYPNYVIPSIMA